MVPEMGIVDPNNVRALAEHAQHPRAAAPRRAHDPGKAVLVLG
jgi:hypothetical protein